MRHLSFAIIAAAVLAEARADDRCTWLVVTVASQHFSSTRDRKGREPDYEESNWGLGGEQCLLGEDVRAVGGFYRNSNRVDSVYFGASWVPLRYKIASAGFAFLMVSGYQVEPVKAPVPVLMLEGKHVGVNLSYVPRTRYNDEVAGLQVKWRWR